MEGGPYRALREIEEMRLQLAVDRLVASGILQPEAAIHAPDPLDRLFGERGVLGLAFEAVRREARQQRRRAVDQKRDAAAQRDRAAAQRARMESMRFAVHRSEWPGPSADGGG
jgi:hypothetical protein